MAHSFGPTTRRGAGMVGALVLVVSSFLMWAGPAAATPKTSVSNLTFSTSTSAGGATEVSWVFGFTAQKALSVNSGTVTVTGPSKTVFSTDSCLYELTDTTAGNTQTCPSINSSGVTVVITVPFTVSAGDHVTLVAVGVSNPASGTAYSGIRLATSGDTTPASPSTGSFTAAKAPGALKFTTTTTAGLATGVSWTATFVASSTGRLIGNAGQITLTAPTSTVLQSNGCDYTFVDVATGRSADCLSVVLSDNNLSVAITVPFGVVAGEKVALRVADVSNPPYKTEMSAIAVATSSDTVAASPSTGTFSKAASIGNVQMSISTTADQVTGVTWSADFTTSATGRLIGGVASISLSAPGTVLPESGYCLSDLTTGEGGCGLGATLGSNGSSAVLTVPMDVAPGDELNLQVVDVSNPKTKASMDEIGLSTSSDLPTVKPLTGSFTADKSVSSMSFSPSSTAGSGSATWSFTYKTSSTGALANSYGYVMIEAPSGTVFPNNDCDYTMDDVTDGVSSESCLSIGDAISAVNIYVPSTMFVHAGDQIEVFVSGVANPCSGTDFSQIRTWTSSNLVSVSPSSGSFS